MEDILSQKLLAAGLRRTKTRLSLLSILHASRDPLSAEHIHTVLVTNYHQACNLSTVYRFLHVMRSHGIVYQLENKDGSALFHLSEKAQAVNRLICRSCEEFMPIPDRNVSLLRSFARQVGYADLGFQVNAYAICQKCKALTQPAERLGHRS